MKIFSYLSLFIFLTIPIEGRAQFIDLENGNTISQNFKVSYFPENNILYLSGEVPIERDVENIDGQISLQNVIADGVKCIVFSNLISIPNNMNRFKNIEKIVFEWSTFDFPRDLFPKLETVDIFFLRNDRHGII